MGAAGADAHHKAISGLPANGVCSESQLTAINAALGRMIASVPESTTMDVYNSVSKIVDSKVPAYLMSTVKEADAKAAYDALIEFTNVVKANPIAASTPASTVSSGAAASISAASSKLSAAAYPFMKDIASVPTSTVMDVYNEMAKLVGNSPVPNFLFS